MVVDVLLFVCEFLRIAGVAQLVVHVPRNDGVAGSNPALENEVEMPTIPKMWSHFSLSTSLFHKNCGAMIQSIQFRIRKNPLRHLKIERLHGKCAGQTTTLLWVTAIRHRQRAGRKHHPDMRMLMHCLMRIFTV